MTVIVLPIKCKCFKFAACEFVELSLNRFVGKNRYLDRYGHHDLVTLLKRQNMWADVSDWLHPYQPPRQ